MTQQTGVALAATRRLRGSAAFRGLSRAEQARFGSDLDRIERALGADPGPASRYGDPYAIAQATPADLQMDLARGGGMPGGGSSSGAKPAAPPAAPAAPARRSAFEQFRDAGDAASAVNFPGFVASLVTGTFQAIVDATVQQLREYAELVSSLSRSVDEFARDNVSPDQVRASLADKHKELRHVAPVPGSGAETSLAIDPDAEGSSPRWLADYGLDGEELTPELVEGALHDAGRTALAEQRMSTLASMVLMGINRIVVDRGDIHAKMQFHAQITDRTDAQLASTQIGTSISARQGAPATQLMVSTVSANTQADASAKASLTGEVRITFRTETFPLERFADSEAIQLLNRHARWRGDTPPAPAAAAPAPGTPGAPGGTPRGGA
jgi:hypothetical protein